MPFNWGERIDEFLFKRGVQVALYGGDGEDKYGDRLMNVIRKISLKTNYKFDFRVAMGRYFVLAHPEAVDKFPELIRSTFPPDLDLRTHKQPSQFHVLTLDDTFRFKDSYIDYRITRVVKAEQSKRDLDGMVTISSMYMNIDYYDPELKIIREFKLYTCGSNDVTDISRLAIVNGLEVKSILLNYYLELNFASL